MIKRPQMSQESHLNTLTTSKNQRAALSIHRKIAKFHRTRRFNSQPKFKMN